MCFSRKAVQLLMRNFLQRKHFLDGWYTEQIHIFFNKSGEIGISHCSKFQKQIGQEMAGKCCQKWQNCQPRSFYIFCFQNLVFVILPNILRQLLQEMFLIETRILVTLGEGRIGYYLVQRLPGFLYLIIILDFCISKQLLTR